MEVLLIVIIELTIEAIWIVATSLSESEKMVYSNRRSWGEASRDPSPKRKIALISSIRAFTTKRLVTCWMKTVAGKGTRRIRSEPKITFFWSVSKPLLQPNTKAANTAQIARTTAGSWMQEKVIIAQVVSSSRQSNIPMALMSTWHCSSKVEKMVLGGRIFQKNSIIFFESNYVIWV